MFVGRDKWYSNEYSSVELYKIVVNVYLITVNVQYHFKCTVLKIAVKHLENVFVILYIMLRNKHLQNQNNFLRFIIPFKRSSINVNFHIIIDNEKSDILRQMNRFSIFRTCHFDKYTNKKMFR